MWKWLRISLLVLCALIAGAAGFVHWRSYRVSSVGHWYGEKSWLGIYCSRGRLIVGVGREGVGAVITHDFYERPVNSKSTDPGFDESFKGGKWLGFAYYQSNQPEAGYVLVPMWALWGVFGLPILVAAFNRMRLRQRRIGNLCVNCGFDLRESSGRCPECGREGMVQSPSLETPVRSVKV